MNNIHYILLIALLPVAIFGQGFYAVSFKDKSETAYSLDQPELFLSAKAISKRQKHNIQLDSLDLPVSSSYLGRLSELGYNIAYVSKWMNTAIIKQATFPEAILELPFTEELSYVGPDIPDFGVSTVFFPEFSGEPFLNKAQLNMLRLDIPKAMEMRGKGITIAIFDAGYRGVNSENDFYDHLFKNNRISTINLRQPGKSVESYSSHGSGVLSIMAADHESYRGIAPDAHYVLAVTEISDGGGFLYEYRLEEYLWSIAAEKCDSMGVDIINTSLGYNIFDDDDMSYTQEDLNGQTAIISRAASIASEKGILCVTSAGNEGNNSWQQITFPADAIGGIAVGAVTSNRTAAGFSSSGVTVDGRLKPDVVALGDNVMRILIDGVIGTSDGTSYSAPLISGFAADLMAYFPDLPASQIRERIINSGHLSSNPDPRLGSGIPNFLTAIDEDLPLNIDFKNTGLYPNPFDQFIQLNGSDYEPCFWKVYSKEGLHLKSQKGGKLLNTQELSSGIYVIQLFYESEVHSIRMIKK